MVMAKISSIDFNWYSRVPQVMGGDDPRKFVPDYVVTEEADTTEESLKSKFADLPAFGLWKDRKESDDELLEELGSGWRGFAAEQ